MPKDSQNICDELKSTVVCRVSGITSLTEQKKAGQSSSLVQIFPSGSHVEATASGASLTISIVPFIYGAVHLVTTYCVQPNYNQNRKVDFDRIYYPFSRNASFDAKNISSEVILLNVKIDEDKFLHLLQFGIYSSTCIWFIS